MSDNQQTIPATPVDSTTLAPDQSPLQVSSDNRPDFIPSADSPQILANSVVVPPPIQSAENLTQSPISTPSAYPVSDAIRPDSIDSADSSQVPADSLPAIVSPTKPPVEEVATPVPAETSIPDLSPPLSAPTVSPDLRSPSDLNLSADQAGNPSPINVSPPDNQVPQVQLEGPKDTSQIDTSQSENQSAEIKPEPLESPTMPSNQPENISPPAPTTSFGDLLTDIPSPISPPVSDVGFLSNPSDLSSQPVSDQTQEPVAPSSSPASTFGELLNQIDPTINIEPIEPPPPPPVSSTVNSQPITQNPQPISQFPLSPLPAEASAKEGPSPTPDIKDNLVLLRQQAKQKKAQKKQATLQKIIDLTKTKGKINNQEAQKILHLPQSTLTDYFQELVSTGTLKREGKGKATYYHL